MGDNGRVEPPLELANDRFTVTVAPDAGGRLAQLAIDGTELLIGPHDVPSDLRLTDGSPAPTAWGAYPMVPWAGRIRHGRFAFRDATYQLPINFGEHAIHGVGFTSAWDVEDVSPTATRLRLDLPADDRWPFGGHVVQEIGLEDTALVLTMEVTATDRAMPVAFGWHPWFRTPRALDFHPARMYRKDADGIAVDELVEVPPGPWDDCFTNTLPVALDIDGVALQLTSDCTHWVVYDQRSHATCVEPQTGPPDAFTIAPRVLEPGESHAAWFRIAAADQPLPTGR